jgi:hypothetical protein
VAVKTAHRTLIPMTDIVLPALFAVSGTLLVAYNISYIVGPFIALSGLCGLTVAAWSALKNAV